MLRRPVSARKMFRHRWRPGEQACWSTVLQRQPCTLPLSGRQMPNSDSPAVPRRARPPGNQSVRAAAAPPRCPTSARRAVLCREAQSVEILAQRVMRVVPPDAGPE
jgi:hypothetical protein